MKRKQFLQYLRHMPRTLRAGQEGSAMVITALAMVVLLGFSALVMDLGVAYFQASKLQNALDSAALAAAMELPADSISSSDWSIAKSKAIALAAANRVTIDAGDLQPIYQNGGSTGKVIGIRVTRSIEVTYGFAGVLGMDSGTVTRTATAKLQSAGGMTGVVPLCITSASLQTAISNHLVTNLLLNCTTKTDEINISSESGWFGALDYDDGQNFASALTDGSRCDVHVGDIVDMENGQMTGPTISGLSSRFIACCGTCTAGSYEPNCPRVVYIPVVNVLGDPYHNQVEIVAFAAFFLESVGTPSDPYVRATYLPEVVVPNTVGGSASEDFGVYVNRLSE